MQTINIAIIDDHLLFRQGLISLIGNVAGFKLVMEAETGKELLEKLKQSDPLPDIILLDMKLPDMTGMELNHFLQKDFPSIKIIVLSIYGQERFIYRMIEDGACAYLLKNCDQRELITAIMTTSEVGFYFNYNAMKAMHSAGKYKNLPLRHVNNIPIELTGREKEILRLICSELTNSEIAAQLFLSIRTVEGHRNNLLMKTGCKNTAGLVIFAIRHGMFEINF